MGKAEYRSSIRSKRLINEALADLMQEKPLDKITVTEVVRRADINRGTFYAHYADIPDVINHLIQNTFAQIRKVLSTESHLERLPDVLLSEIQKILETDLDFYKKVMRSSGAAVMYEQMVNITVEYMLQNEQEFGVGDRELYVMTIRFCAGGLSDLYRQWFAGNLDMSLSELTEYGKRMIDRVLSIR